MNSTLHEALDAARNLERGLPRRLAAKIVDEVAELGEVGLFPQEVTSEDLGRALYRIVGNSEEPDPLIGLVTGWMRGMLRGGNRGLSEEEINLYLTKLMASVHSKLPNTL